jgi:predicted ribosome quality control (RQC) complex YloA/Tae2 family protein
MAKKSVSSLELAAIMNELQFLVNGKISQIYHQDKKEMLFQLHAPGKGKVLLKLVTGKFLCLTDKKDVPLRPSGFCMQLRKYLDNAFIKDFYQKGSERIVVFELEKKEKFFLIAELFSKGNLIFTDEKYKIIGTLERQIWKDRVVKPHETYIFPKVGINWKELDKKNLTSIFKDSEKKNLGTSLATEIGLGGLYSEEICKKKDINKDKLPSEASEEDVSKIIQALTKFIEEIRNSKGYIYENEVTPFPLLNQEPRKVMNTYNEAINTLNPFEVISPYEQKINTMESRVNQQESAIKKQEEKIVANKLKGEKIYEQYAPLQQLLDAVKQLRTEGKEWDEIAVSLKKEKKIISVNLKEKKVVIDL